MEFAKGYIGLTDPDWYGFLCNQPRVDEVNFWQPHGNRPFRVLQPGEPFFFKLRAPHRAIAGFGFFERFESLPAWQAWQYFGEMNGAPDSQSMIRQILALRGDDGPAMRMGDFTIGCVMISAPVFFPPGQWVSPPSDWAKSGIQQGKTYRLDSGEGRRVLGECLERARTGARYWNIEPAAEIVAEGSPRYGSAVTVRPRWGQGIFSAAVRNAYEGACTVTREHSGPVLEAAHIVPYREGGRHKVENGLLLRSDLHRFYDHGYVTVTADHVFRVGGPARNFLIGAGRRSSKADRGLSAVQVLDSVVTTPVTPRSRA